MKRSVKSGEEGFILVFTLLLMVVLVLLGVSAIDTSIFESAMSTNDALYKRAFYQADGGANVAGVVIEENVSCPKGFDANLGSDALIAGNVVIKERPSPYNDLALWKNSKTEATKPSDTNRDAYFFYNATDPTGIQPPHNNMKTGGETVIATGSALQMAAGYEGRGKGMASGGAYINYDVFSQHIGDRQSESIVEIVWRHVIGFEGSCNY